MREFYALPVVRVEVSQCESTRMAVDDHRCSGGPASVETYRHRAGLVVGNVDAQCISLFRGDTAALVEGLAHELYRPRRECRSRGCDGA
jgi:hypothetical protein